MAGLGPAIHVLFIAPLQDVDAQHKAGRDGKWLGICPRWPFERALNIHCLPHASKA
jgi:hypothetical protein